MISNWSQYQHKCENDNKKLKFGIDAILAKDDKIPITYQHTFPIYRQQYYSSTIYQPRLQLPATQPNYSTASTKFNRLTTFDCKRKRSWSRAVFSNLQRKGLEKRFEVQKYVTKPDRRQLAAMLGLTDAQVKVWFQNRRMKWRHQKEKEAREEENAADDSDDDVDVVL